jgi:hypothetical protein
MSAMPATWSGGWSANIRADKPPSECPTSTYGPGMPAVVSKVCSSRACCMASRGAGPLSLQPSSARS